MGILVRTLSKKPRCLCSPCKTRPEILRSWKLLEAIACGLPMVVMYVGAIRDYVHEDCAEFVPAFDSDAMFLASLCLVNDRERHGRMPVAARQRACSLESGLRWRRR